MKNFISFLVLVCLTSTIHCAPVDNQINSDALIDNKLKNAVSVDQALNSPKSSKVEDTTTSNLQLFNNNEADEDKMFKISDADELIETSNLSPMSKQATGGMPNVQSLIDQTNTITTNLDNMIKDMTQNRRHATAAMLKMIQQNVKRLNVSLVRLNNRISTLPIIGNSPQSASSSSTSSASSSVSSNISNATISAAQQINGVVTNIRNQLNTVSNEINNLLQRIRLSMPTGSSKPANSKPTPKP